MNYDETAITQKVELVESTHKKVSFLFCEEGEGYKHSLSKSYFKKMNDFLQECETIQDSEELEKKYSRIIFTAEDSYVAKQAALILGQKKHEMLECNCYDEFEYYDISHEQPVLVFDYKETKKEETKDKNVAEEEEENRKKLREIDVTRNNVPEKPEKIFLELGMVEQPDKMVEDILAWDNKQIFLWMLPNSSAHYILKRLVFEGNYCVVPLGNPTLKDYEEYAQSYMKHYGFTIKSNSELHGMLSGLKSYRGALMTEKDIYRHLSRAFDLAGERGEKELSEEDIAVNYYGTEESSQEEWSRMIGLEEINQSLKRAVAAQSVLDERSVALHRNMIFTGFPGVGKSVVARLYAKMLAEKGLSNGRFVDVNRADLIGKYVGHTAPKVRGAFEKAKGGVLFVDEAAFLLAEDTYVKEAVIEFVRFMELFPETTVIFATYPKEAEALRRCDAGFASRIGKVLLFPNYSNEELYKIMTGMAENFGLQLEEGCYEVMSEYIDGIRESESFANAREVRRLLETAIEEYGLEEGRNNRVISCDNMRNAVRQMRDMDLTPKVAKLSCGKRKIGF